MPGRKNKFSTKWSILITHPADHTRIFYSNTRTYRATIYDNQESYYGDDGCVLDQAKIKQTIKKLVTCTKILKY